MLFVATVSFQKLCIQSTTVVLTFMNVLASWFSWSMIRLTRTDKGLSNTGRADCGEVRREKEKHSSVCQEDTIMYLHTHTHTYHVRVNLCLRSDSKHLRYKFSWGTTSNPNHQGYAILWKLEWNHKNSYTHMVLQMLTVSKISQIIAI